MKKLIQYKVIFGITGALLALNLFVTLCFSHLITLSAYSLMPAGFLALVILNGILACVDKDRGNFLKIRSYNKWVIWHERDLSEDISYQITFRWSLLVYCLPIPFYIPFIFFVPNAWTFLSFLLFLIPQILYSIQDFYEIRQEIKKAKQRDAELEKERIEQEKREELGYWK